jgi:flagellar hook-associated protein 2
MVAGDGISVTGLASGLDTASLIQKLVQVESQGKVALQTQQSGIQTTLSTFQQFEALVQTLHDKASVLSTTSSFLQLQGSTSVQGVITANVSSTAQQGSHSITIQQLAQTDRWAFDGIPDATTSLGAGTVSFNVNGNSYSVNIDPASSSLNDIANAINQQAGTDVNASVVNVGTSSAPSWRLVLGSNTSGVDGRIHAITSTVGGLTIDNTEPAAGSNTPVSADQLAVGQNAKALVDGLQVERDTNEFSDALPGVSFTAQSADPQNPVTLTISPNSTAIQSSLQDFVAAYNAVAKFMNTQNTYSSDNGAGGPLFGDSTMQMVGQTIHSALFNVSASTVAGDSLGYSTLGLVGLNLQSDGTMTVDQSTLSSKITGNVTALAQLFAGGPDHTANPGMAQTLVSSLESLTEPGAAPDGTALASIFGAKESSLQDQINELDHRISDEDQRLSQFQAELQARFANLETVMGQLNSQTAALQAMLGQTSQSK